MTKLGFLRASGWRFLLFVLSHVPVFNILLDFFDFKTFLSFTRQVLFFIQLIPKLSSLIVLLNGMTRSKTMERRDLFAVDEKYTSISRGYCTPANSSTESNGKRQGKQGFRTTLSSL